MRIEIEIVRQADGRLKAWVVQEGRYGDKNLLAGRSLSNVEHAKQEITSRLLRQLRCAAAIEVVWRLKG